MVARHSKWVQCRPGVGVVQALRDEVERLRAQLAAERASTAALLRRGWQGSAGGGGGGAAAGAANAPSGNGVGPDNGVPSHGGGVGGSAAPSGGQRPATATARGNHRSHLGGGPGLGAAAGHAFAAVGGSSGAVGTAAAGFGGVGGGLAGLQAAALSGGPLAAVSADVLVKRHGELQAALQQVREPRGGCRLLESLAVSGVKVNAHPLRAGRLEVWRVCSRCPQAKGAPVFRCRRAPCVRRSGSEAWRWRARCRR